MEKRLHGRTARSFFQVYVCTFSLLFIMIPGLGFFKTAEASDPKLMGIRTIFNQMEKALQEKDEATFRSLWFVEGYHADPTGHKGYSGEEAFESGTEDGWYIKPDFKTMLLNGLDDIIKDHDVVILPSHVWSFEKHKPIKDIYIAIVHNGEKWLVLGLSEESHDVEQIVEQFKNPW